MKKIKLFTSKYMLLLQLCCILIITVIINVNIPDEFFEIDKSLSNHASLVALRYSSLSEQFTQIGDNFYLRKYVKNTLKDKVIYDHIATLWVDQLTFITVKSCYKLQDSKGIKYILTIKANISDDGKILKYEVINYDTK